MLPASAPAGEDPLEDDAVSPSMTADVAAWFLTDAERANPHTDLRSFSTGNSVKPLIDGHNYFMRLCAELDATEDGDEIYFLDFSGDFDERLGGSGSTVGEAFVRAAEREVRVFGLLWRSHPKAFGQSEESNAELVRRISDHGGQVLLDARTRRIGSHHQKLVVIRHRGQPERDVAFIGGIDLSHSRNDDSEHYGDPQPMEFPDAYGPTPPWHDIQAEVRGPAVHDLEHTFRERWYGSSVLDIPSPLRQLYDRAYHMAATTNLPLPEPVDDDRSTTPGRTSVQVLRTYPARIRRYPFAPLGERSIAHAYRKAFDRARQLVYLEDQFFWSRPVATVLADALHSNPDLHVLVVVPRVSNAAGAVKEVPALLGRQEAMNIVKAAAGDRFAIYDVENHADTPVYVHAKVVVVDDVWAMIGSDNLNRRSWTHDSELAVAVLDEQRDAREPIDPAGLGDGARVFARDLRLRLWREHLDRSAEDFDDLLDPLTAFEAFARQAQALEQWHRSGRAGPRPPGRVRPHLPAQVNTVQQLWAKPLLRAVYDPDGRAVRDRIRRRS